MSEFTGRRAVIMGGSRGIGRSIALGFARAGAAVAICARGAEALEATRRELEAAGATAYAAPCDLADPAAIARFVPDAAAALGGINILVNNASAFAGADDEAGWAASVDIDLMATVRASAAALPFLEHASEGAIVNVTSISAHARRQAQPALWRHQGGGDPLHREPGPQPRRPRHPGERRRPRLHRVPRRLVGAAPQRRPRAL